MQNRIRSFLLLSVLSLGTLAISQTRSQAYLSYIERYHQLAQKQQKEYGIPSSITLAQGLFESGAGLGPLAKMSNNHFGIKCSDWSGEKVYHDDDEKGECFRKYTQVIESYEDHSLFLKNRSRYAFLFDLKQTDYKGWAYGLKKAGYATDPTYATRLISIIEVYELYQYDLGTNTNDDDEAKSGSKKDLTTAYGSIGSVRAAVQHEVVKVNGARFVTSLPGDTYASVADEFNVTEKKLLKYNDLNVTTQLRPGTRVFISPKKNKAPIDCESHTVFMGESMRSISQDYGVKVKKLYQLNNIPDPEGPTIGQVLRLR